jgi:hypothetical protein
MDGKITLSERKALITIHANILLTVCALLIFMSVQVVTSGLTYYHALIVLNLSWINNAGMLAWCYMDFLGDENGKDNRKVWTRLPFPFSNGSSSSTCVYAHLSAIAGLGIWICSQVATFEDQPHCSPGTSTNFFDRDIPVTIEPVYIASMVVYSITALPGINLVLLVTLFMLMLLGLAVFLVKMMRGWDSSFTRRLAFIGGPLLCALLDLLFVINTELMIRRNKGLVKEGESRWTFSQTLAMLMVVLPLVEVTKQGISRYRGDPEDKVASSANQEIKLAGNNLDASEPSPLTV